MFLQKTKGDCNLNLSEINVVPAKEKQFGRKGIETVENLLHFYPRRYIDCTKTTELQNNEFCVIVAVLKNVKQYNTHVPMIRAYCIEENTQSDVNVLWFRKDYIFPALSYMQGSKVLIAGKVTYSAEYKNYSISNPFIFTDLIEESMRIYPVYSKIPGMGDDYLFSKIHDSLVHTELMHDIWPRRVVKENEVMDTTDTFYNIHFPKSEDSLNLATNRLIFDDMLYFALNMEKAKRNNSAGTQYNVTNFETNRKVLNSLPYKLTEDQRTIMRELMQNAREGRRINALVQGDVGSGKSIIAYLSMIAMGDSGYQAALMAPTQVLAQQHYDELKKLVEPHGMKVAFFGGTTMKKAEKEKIYKGIQSGEIQFVVGTHALLNPDITFKDLAMIIVDEEHKFGVIQRDALTEKASRGVHFITMSATPIPRSLAQVLYGDTIQLCTIRSMPNGRKPIVTLTAHNQDSVFRFIDKQVKAGRQVYVVCPMIDKNEDMEGVISVEELKMLYSKALTPLGISIATLTGRTSKTDLQNIISEYKAGNINVLIATTVIEVGVNVPNASVIVIHNAERFGLAGLHQLRGRVGRGQYQSYCILFSEDQSNPRLQVMCETNDGFKIAEEDLKLRGTGELIGLKQSGDDKYVSLMLAYPEKYKAAKKIANELIDSGEHKKSMQAYEQYRLANIPAKRSKSS